MSLLIRGMDMPIGCAKIEIGLDAEGNPMAMVGDKVFDVVQVPPHGRLIDADAMVKLWKGCKVKGDITCLIDIRPTVIEAEEGKQ